MEKVLVTGAAGFIGMHTALKLASTGYEVVGLDVINDYYDINLKYDRLKRQGVDHEQLTYNFLLPGKSNISFIQLDLEDGDNVARLFQEQKFDYVINLAAQAGVRYSLQHPMPYIKSNITGFLNILEGCRHQQVKHLIYASSSSVYGLNEEIPFTERKPTEHPLSLYAASKKSNEMMAHTYSHLFDLPTTGLRFFTVYGPWGRPDMALFIFTKKILENQPIEVFNNGNMFRDFTYIDDIVEGVVGLLPNVPKRNEQFDKKNPVSDQSSAPYQIFNIGNSAPVNLMDFVRAIENKIEKKAEIIYKPLQPGDVTQTYASTESLQQAIGYKPDTSIEYGISEFIDWYREYYKE